MKHIQAHHPFPTLPMHWHPPHVPVPTGKPAHIDKSYWFMAVLRSLTLLDALPGRGVATVNVLGDWIRTDLADGVIPAFCVAPNRNPVGLAPTDLLPIACVVASGEAG